MTVELPISAADINRSMPHAVAQSYIERTGGNTDKELLAVGQRGMALPPVSSRPANQVSAQTQATLDQLQHFLGIRTT